MVRELVEVIIKAIVDHPDQVRITKIVGRGAAMIEVRTAEEDLGKVIGKQGRNIQAMRTIVKATSGKIRKHVILELVE